MMDIFEIILLIFAIILALFLFGSFLYLTIGWFKFLYHDLLGWHKPAKNAGQSSDGWNVQSVCRYCNKKIMEDSQGNWFEIDVPVTTKKEPEPPVYFGKWRLETDEEMFNPMFKLVVCTYCNEKASSPSKFCPHCGKPMQ